MRSINKVILIGNVAKEPDLKSTNANQSLCTFVLATNREWFSGESNSRKKQSLAEFHNITAWGSMAEKCNKFIKKGKLVYVEGYLKTRKFDNEDGTKSYRTEIVIHDMILLNKKNDTNDNFDENDDDFPEMTKSEIESLDAVKGSDSDDNVF